MEETLKNNGWIVFKTGCSCNGRPKYWKNEKDPDYNIVTKFSGFQIRQKNIIVANGKPDQLIQKMTEHGIIDVD